MDRRPLRLHGDPGTEGGRRVDDSSTVGGRNGPNGDRRPRRLDKPRQRRAVATSPNPADREGLVGEYSTAEERRLLARYEALRKTQDDLGDTHKSERAQLEQDGATGVEKLRLEIRHRDQHADLLAAHGFREHAATLERKNLRVRIECRQIATRELDGARQAVQPSGRGFVNELELRLRRHLVRSRARRGPPDSDADTDADDLASVVEKIIRWLTGQKQGVHRDQH